MQVKTTVTQDISANDMAAALANAGPEVFGEFFLALYSAMREQKVDLDEIAKVMAADWGSGRKEVFNNLSARITYFEEHARRNEG